MDQSLKSRSNTIAFSGLTHDKENIAPSMACRNTKSSLMKEEHPLAFSNRSCHQNQLKNKNGKFEFCLQKDTKMDSFKNAESLGKRSSSLFSTTETGFGLDNSRPLKKIKEQSSTKISKENLILNEEEESCSSSATKQFSLATTQNDTKDKSTNSEILDYKPQIITFLKSQQVFLF